MQNIEVFNLLAGTASFLSLVIALWSYSKVKKVEKKINQKAGKKSIQAAGNIKIAGK